MAAKKPEAQVGEELEQLAAATEQQAAEEAVLPDTKAQQDEEEVQVLVIEYPPIVRNQADRLLRLFELPEGHPGRNERIKEYQDALVRNGIESPPRTRLEAHLFISAVGEYHG